MTRTEQIIAAIETHHDTMLGKWQKRLVASMMAKLSEEFATYLLNNCNQNKEGYTLKDMPTHVYTPKEIFEKFNNIT
jgi:hypothetical protein